MLRARTSPRLAQSALIAFILCSGIRLFAQHETQAAAGTTPPKSPALPTAYDVISLKPHAHNESDTYHGWRNTPSGIVGSDVSVRSLIMPAYHLIMFDQISGLPPWADTDTFDLEAKLDPANAEALAKMPEQGQESQRQLMLRSLLADRFKLKISQSTKELPVFDLVIAKGGPKLKEAISDRRGYNVTMGALCTMTSDSLAASELADSLANFANRIVIDKTGLKGKYQVTLNWAFNENFTNAGPSLFTALQEQLGLKLEPAKAPVDVIVIDHIERPSEN